MQKYFSFSIDRPAMLARKDNSITHLGRTFLIFSDQISDWKSAGIISQNLLKAYSLYLKEDLQAFHLSEELNRDHSEVLKLARALFDAKPERLVFIDDVVSPRKLLVALDEVYGNYPLPSLYFHLYGNFTLNTPEWSEIAAILKKASVQFICASRRQAQLVQNFLSQKCQTSVCPFPVDTQHFFPSPDLRTKYRSLLGIGDKEIVLLYSGRLSAQKNILRLVEEFSKLCLECETPLRILFAGEFEDRGIPLFKTSPPQLGTYFHFFCSFLEKLNPEIQKRIQFLGPQGTKDLNGIYNAADIFTSLSLYHDEDFGMAPAEALTCGLPAVLSNWGGYADFDLKASKDFPICSLVDVALTTQGFKMSSESFQSAFHEQISAILQHQSDTVSSNEIRLKRSLLAQSKFSVVSIAQELSGHHTQSPARFLGFSDLMKKHAQSIQRKTAPFPGGPKKGGLYGKVYSAYLSK